jgi:ADP-heptose:LPS heptosyltransferase
VVGHGPGFGGKKNITENNPVKKINRILFIRSDRLGDVLMNLPAIAVLRKAYPKAWIALLVNRPVSDLFNDHPDVDEIIAVEADELLRSRRKQWQLIAKIRSIRFDLAVASNPSKFFHSLMFFSGIPLRVGWRRKWPFFLNRTLPDTKGNAMRHEIDWNLDLVRLVTEQKWDGQLALPGDDRSAEKIHSFLKQSTLPVVALHPGTSNPKKRWPPERFVELCERLLSTRRCQVVLIGGQEEAVLSREVTGRLSAPVLDLTGRLTLKELAAFFKQPQVKMLVSSDSGPVHVAWMSGKPVIALYAENVEGCNPVRWGPRDGRSEVIFKPIDEITVHEVWERVQRFL